MQLLNPLTHANWDADLVRHPNFSVFHGAAWTRLLVETYGFQPVWMGDSEGMLPLMEVDSWLTGRRGMALPFTDECAPLCGSAEQLGPLFQQALTLGIERRWRTIEIRGGRRLLPAARPSMDFYGHRLDLTVGTEKLFAQMAGSARQAVRKAEHAGVTVEILQSLAGMRDFYRLQCLTRRRHGLPPQPWNFFLNLWSQVMASNQGAVVLATTQGQRVAGAIFLFLGGRAVFKYGASDDRGQQLRPNNLVMWAGIRWLAGRGATVLDLGRTSPMHEGLRRFKRHLGATEYPIEYVKFDLQRQAFVTERDKVEGWYNWMFRTLPIWLGRGAGRLLYRHWA